MNKFTNSWKSMFYNESYLIRKSLYNAIKDFAVGARGKLLDFGCGDKPYQSLFNVDEYIGIDFPNTKHSKLLETRTDILEYDGKNIPFGEDTFDVIISTEVFEHLFNLEEVLQELNRVLKKDGQLFFTCPFSYGEHEVPYDYARYTRFALYALLDKHGFTEINTKKTGNMVTVILQYMALYNYYIVHRTGLMKSLFFLIMVTPFFFISNLLNVILPKKLLRNDVYLNNVVQCKKK